MPKPALKVRDAMTATVRTISPGASIQEAAALMGELDAGVLPVMEQDRLVGMVTDRDIALRAVAAGLGGETRVSDVMTPEVKFCYEDEVIERALAYMRGLQVRRLPVLSREQRLCGILSLGDVAMQADNDAQLGDTLSGISEPGGPHSQTSDA